ncbi:hypothetical protein C8Q72DRAFT_382062 [Fomitopsis betulina]|nr:hypothetical protein C8Q72DRAFT_382062 [Fomitopsis betulina]
MNYRRIGCQIPLRSVYLSPRLGHRPLDQHPTTIQHPEYESANVSTVQPTYVYIFDMQHQAAVVTYDHALTLTDNIRLIWNRKPFFNVASCIFIANRLFLWLYSINILLSIFWDYNTRMFPRSTQCPCSCIFRPPILCNQRWKHIYRGGCVLPGTRARWHKHVHIDRLPDCVLYLHRSYTVLSESTI